MMLSLPIEEIIGKKNIGYDIAADFLELAAFLSCERAVATSVIVNEASIGAPEDYAQLEDELIGNEELPHEEELLCGTIERISERQCVLRTSYPFCLNSRGEMLNYNKAFTSSSDDISGDIIGQTAYMMCLLLSNLQTMSPILAHAHPTACEERELRTLFQYFSTAALAAEVRGRAWSFGFPRSDGSGFMSKLNDIWLVLGDGRVVRQAGAPVAPKDDKIDVFAARPHADGMPGFPILVGQVATGIDYREKYLVGHVEAFKSRWFAPQPVTKMIEYMIIPFAIKDDDFIDHVRTMGNILHRLRMPKRAAEVKENQVDEIYEYLKKGSQMIDNYRNRILETTT